MFEQNEDFKVFAENFLYVTDNLLWTRGYRVVIFERYIIYDTPQKLNRFTCIETISLYKFTINVWRTSNLNCSIYLFKWSENDVRKAIEIVNTIRMFRLVRIRRFSTFRTVKQSKPKMAWVVLIQGTIWSTVKINGIQ